MIAFLTGLVTWVVAIFGVLISIAFLENQSGLVITGVVVGILVLRWFVARLIRKARLMKKYQNEDVVRKIMSKTLWVGATKEMVRDSWGRPGDVKQGSHKSEWCYGSTGKGRWRHRVQFKGTVVVSYTER